MYADDRNYKTQQEIYANVYQLLNDYLRKYKFRYPFDNNGLSGLIQYANVTTSLIINKVRNYFLQTTSPRVKIFFGRKLYLIEQFSVPVEPFYKNKTSKTQTSNINPICSMK